MVIMTHNYTGLIGVIVLCCTASFSHGQTSASDPCSSAQSSCEECITADPQCTWCADVDYNQTRTRCRTASENNLLCSEIINPMTEVQNVRNLNFSEITDPPPSENEAIQLMPQASNIKLRIGETMKYNVTFKKIIQYPLDLYYIMDLSYSMKDDLQTLQKLGTTLVKSIKEKITKNVQLGFGTFVDKVVLPYATNDKDVFDNLCSGECEPTFDFHHQLKVTDNTVKFEEVVNSTIISANLDIPEGGFDALLQIAACTETIGWRKNALHVALLTSDAPSHIAMDGKLGGIFEKNDMLCHLQKIDSTSDIYWYTKEASQDYPSIGQLRKVFQENNVQVIFAVTENVFDIYQNLSGILPATVGKLANDSNNILAIIESAYDEIKGRFEMSSPQAPSNIDLTYRLLCPNSLEWRENKLLCENVTIGDEVIFQLEMKATSCPQDPNHKDVILVESNSITENVTLIIDYHCECECSTSNQSSSKCQDQGNLVCGICNCDPGRHGTYCQCISSLTHEQLLLNCTDPNPAAVDSNAICNNNGYCECGLCKDNCYNGFYGEFCQCSSFGCPADDISETICGGPEKGVCENCYNDKQCICNSDGGWYLDNSTKTCVCNDNSCKKSETDTDVCSGNGRCSCNECVCNNTLHWTDTYCDKCIHPICNTLDGSCGGVELKECSLCVYSYTATQECKAKCEDIGITFKTVSSLPSCNNCSESTASCEECADLDENIFKSVDCQIKDSSDCTVSYKIGWNVEVKNYFLFVKRRNFETDCPQPIAATLIILPIVGVILLGGIIAMIVWKVIRIQYDKKKYEEFQRELEKKRWNASDNPLHKQAATRIMNPNFVGDDVDIKPIASTKNSYSFNT